MSRGLDLSPLRVSPAYRRLFTYGAVSMVAGQATYVTVMYQMKLVTHSTFEVGALGLAELLPIIVGGLYGGVLADRLERRRVVLVMDLGLLVGAALLLFNATMTRPSAALIYVAAAVLALCSALQGPSREALTQQLVPHELQRSVAALEMSIGNIAMLVGPVLGGAVAVAAGSTTVYGLDVASFALTIPLILTWSVVQPPREGARVTLADGVRYARSRRDILGSYVVDLWAMFWAYPIALLPFIAARYPESYALALLYAALPAGALVASLGSGWFRWLHHYGRAIVVTAVVWCVMVGLIGVVRPLWAIAVALVAAGFADEVSGLFRMTLWNESIPLEVRGRLAGMELLSYSIGPTAGQARAGLMATRSLRGSVVVAGAIGAGGAGVCATALRALWRFDARTDPHVAHLRASRQLEGVDDAQ